MNQRIVMAGGFVVALLSVAAWGLLEGGLVLTPSAPVHADVLQRSLEPPGAMIPSSLDLQRLLDAVAESPSVDTSDAAARLITAAKTDPSVIRGLTRRLRQGRGRPALLAILVRVGPSAVSHVTPLLDRGDADVRWSALRFFLSLEVVPKEAIPGAIRSLKDDDVWVRRWSAMLLADVDSDECRGALLDACDDEDEEVRWRSLMALSRDSRMSPAARVALERARLDPDPDVRYVADLARQSRSADGRSLDYPRSDATSGNRRLNHLETIEPPRFLDE